MQSLAKTIRDEFRAMGYDFEEQYFYELNRELIARLRAERELMRARPVSHLRALPRPPLGRVEKWMQKIFKPLPT